MVFSEAVKTIPLLLKHFYCNYESSYALSTYKSNIFQTEAAIFWTDNEKPIIEKGLAPLLGIISKNT